MEKITLRQFLEFTNLYVPIYIEDEFQRHTTELDWPGHLLKVLGDKKLSCPIDYFRNVDGGHMGDKEKARKDCFVIGIGYRNWEKYFGEE